MTVRTGVVGRTAKCHFMGGFACLGAPKEKPISIYFVTQGRYEEIATRYIQKIIEDERGQPDFDQAFLEPVQYYEHELLLVHLPTTTLCFDGVSKQWSELFSNSSRTMPYQGIHHIYNGQRWTVASKTQNLTGVLDHTNTLNFGEKVSHTLYSQMIQVRNKRLYDLDIDGVFGQDGENINIGLSYTLDGLTYSPEEWINYSVQNDRTKRVLKRRLGYVQNNIGFRLRILGNQPITVSNLRVRVE